MINRGPSATSRLPFYYGWVIALGGAVNASFVLGSAQFALSTFLVPMEESLGWSRTVFFGALSTRFLLAGMLGPLVGPLSDHARAPRFIMPAGVLLLGGSLGAIRWVESPLMFFALYGGVGAVASSLLHLTMWEAIMLKWFSKKRTCALVIGGIGEGSGAFVFPMLVTLLIALSGWRDAWLWYGIITIVVLMPIALAVRTRPEQLGQHLDGLPADPEPRSLATTTVMAEVSFTRHQAVRTQGFWMLAGAFTLSGVVITGFQSQWIPHFRDIGVSATLAATAVSVYGALNISSRVIWGVLVSRFPLQRMMVTHAVAAFLGVAFMVFVVHNTITVFIWAAYQGLVLGSFFSLHTMLSAEYFGRFHIGSIRGAMMPSASLSRAGGPLLLGALRDWRGTYDLAFVVVLGGWAAMASMVFLSHKPRQSTP
ncbi:MAG: MFS transporter [Chloroflexi bacterium]|nr:MFS transporter [Chloroflexota bacterium]